MHQTPPPPPPYHSKDLDERKDTKLMNLYMLQQLLFMFVLDHIKMSNMAPFHIISLKLNLQ